MKIYLLAFTFYFLFFPAVQRGHITNTISWAPHSKLKWEDFQGVPDSLRTNAEQSATKTKIEVVTKITSTSFHYKVSCFFEKDKSWTVNDTSKTLLAHEQLHFDITEIYARSLRQKLMEMKSVPARDLEKEVRQLYNEILLACVQFQKKYDSETNHSKNIQNQKIWNDRIIEILDKTDDYSVTTIIVKRK